MRQPALQAKTAGFLRLTRTEWSARHTYAHKIFRRDQRDSRFNDPHPQGYTFRVYHPGWIRGYMDGQKNPRATLEPAEAAVPALAYFLQPRDDEGQLAMYDWPGNLWHW